MTQVGRVISPSSYAHVLALVKFKLQTPTEHLSLSQPGFLVIDFVKKECRNQRDNNFSG
jgi:hypothetical protein